MLQSQGRNAWVVFGIVACLLAATSVDAEAQRRRRGKAKTKGAPQSAEISSSMGELRWGMSKDEVLDWAVGQVKERYRKPLAQARDAITEDRLRHQMRDEIKKIRESYVRFDGKTTGWDVSYLRDEFAHSSGEAMLVVEDGNSKNFYFFIRDRLWKWYKAFDADVFQGRSFDQFASAVQGRFGEAKRSQRELEWQDEDTRLRAVDQTRFYGFYCLVFEEKNTLSRLASLRRNAPKRKAESHALVDSVTSGPGEADPDQAPDIVDRITGKIRNRPSTPSKASRASTGKSGRSDDAASSAPAPTVGGVTDEDDPLRGLDF